MAGVLGMLDLLRLTTLTPEQAGFVRVMQGSAEGLMQVLNEILDFSRIQSGHLSLDVADFHIGELLDQVCSRLIYRYDKKSCKSFARLLIMCFPDGLGDCVISRSFD